MSQSNENKAVFLKLCNEINNLTDLLKACKDKGGTMSENGRSVQPRLQPNPATVCHSTKPISSAYQYTGTRNQRTYYRNNFSGSHNHQTGQDRSKFIYRSHNMTAMHYQRNSSTSTARAASAQLPQISTVGLPGKNKTSNCFNPASLTKVNSRHASLLNKTKNIPGESLGCKASVEKQIATSTIADIHLKHKVVKNEPQILLANDMDKEGTVDFTSNSPEAICISSNSKISFDHKPQENSAHQRELTNNVHCSSNSDVPSLDTESIGSQPKESVQLSSELSSVAKNVPPTQYVKLPNKNNVLSDKNDLVPSVKTPCSFSNSAPNPAVVNKSTTRSHFGKLSSYKTNLSKFKYVSNNSLQSLKCHQATENNNFMNPVHNKSKRLVTSTYKVVNKNSPFYTKHSNNLTVQTKSYPTPVSKGTVTPKNLNRLLQFRKLSSVSTKKCTTPLSMKKVIQTKYKIVNRKKSPCSTSTKAADNLLTSSVAKDLLLSKIQSTLPVLNNTQSNSKGVCKKNKINEHSTSPKVLTDIKNCGANSSEAVARKLDFRKQSGINSKLLSENEKYRESLKKEKGFDLTSLTPEELVSLDHGSLLKLSAMVTSTQPKRKSFIKKTKYKIVSKRKSLTSSIKKRIPAWKSEKIGGQSDIRLHQSGQRNKNYKFASKKSYFSVEERKRKLVLEKQHERYRNMVTIGDISYRMSKTNRGIKVNSKKFSTGQKPTVVVVRGVRFQMDPSGKSLKKLPANENEGTTPLKRINLGGKTYIGTTPDTFTETPSSQVRNLVSRVLHRSIQTAVAATAKKTERKDKFCMFYNRFGKCNHQSNCPYIHDPSKIAVCTRFLRGTCKVDNCPFSHERNPGKMAICSFFIQGACTTKDCPYRHERLEPNAELCQDFVRGYCALAGQCKKAHILVCPQFLQGRCERESCPYPHPPRKEKRKLEETEEENLKQLYETSNEKLEGEEEFRYYKSTTPVDSVQGTHSTVNREGCTWVGRDAPVLAKYIPLSFADDETCLI